MSDIPRCCCIMHDPRECYTLRYYGITGLGAPNKDENEECDCTCHWDYDPEEGE